tara:strand:- start:225 stop:662 length:438 start_codon:yes stop_codon:yes gene_type:complete
MKKALCFILIITLFACDQTVNKSSLEIKIEGMSCSHSCAPSIQKKLIETKGVIDAKVIFEQKSASVIFDSNVTSKKEIVQKIETIYGGTYKTTEVIERKVNNSDEKNKKSEESSSVEFNLSKTNVSHSSGFQIPNLFNLLNSILN